MQTRSKTSLSRSQLIAEPTFETRRSRRLQLVEPTVANISAMEVSEWLNQKSNANREYDSDNDSTSTYNTEDADADFCENNWLNQLQPKYTVEIDFDEASRAWKANKRSIGNGSYRYVTRSQNKNTKTMEVGQTTRTRGMTTRSQTAAASASK